MDLLTSEESILFIQRCREEGTRILGIDGFVVTASGLEAKIDMTLDISEPMPTVEESADISEGFVKTHASSDVVFEICVDALQT